MTSNGILKQRDSGVILFLISYICESLVFILLFYHNSKKYLTLLDPWQFTTLHEYDKIQQGFNIISSTVLDMIMSICATKDCVKFVVHIFSVDYMLIRASFLVAFAISEIYDEDEGRLDPQTY